MWVQPLQPAPMSICSSCTFRLQFAVIKPHIPSFRAFSSTQLASWDPHRHTPSRIAPSSRPITVAPQHATPNRKMHTHSRQSLGWGARIRGGRTAKTLEEDDAVRQNEEDAARSAVLEKVFESRQPTDLMLRCTVLDSGGNVQTISGSFKKSDLCQEHRLNHRDLRKIDSRIPNLVPTILVRKDAFLVNVLHIRALIKADAVLLFDTFGSADSTLSSMFLYHLEHNLKKQVQGLPYEFRALESVLLSVLSALESEMVVTRHLVGGLLAELEDDIDRDKFKRLLHYSRRLGAFQNRAKLVQAAIDEVLEQDEDLAAMYLSDKKAGRPRLDSDHDELEVLLESFSKQVEEIVNESETMMHNISATQEIVELILDATRNNLLALDLKVSIVTMGLGAGALFAGLFGMNLANGMEDSFIGFTGASAMAVGLALWLAWMGNRRLNKIRRVGLSRTPQRANRVSLVPIPRGQSPRHEAWL